MAYLIHSYEGISGCSGMCTCTCMKALCELTLNICHCLLMQVMSESVACALEVLDKESTRETRLLVCYKPGRYPAYKRGTEPMLDVQVQEKQEACIGSSKSRENT